MIAQLRRRLTHLYLHERGFASGRGFTEEMLDLPSRASVFLDAGCGEGELRAALGESAFYVGVDRHFGRRGTEYESWIHRPNVVADLQALPLADRTVDRVALLHVLEHVREPGRVLAVLARAMKPGGRLYVDVPFVHEIHHAPEDYYRFTPQALRYLLQSAGLTVLSIRPSGGYFRCLSHVLKHFRVLVADCAWLGKLALAPLVLALAIVRALAAEFEYLLDLADSKQTLVCGYVCVAEKRS